MRYFAILILAFGTQGTALAQCTITPSQDPRIPLEVRADLLGRDATGARFTLRASCPGEPDSRVPYKVDSQFRGIIASPAEGVTPIEIEVGVNPDYLGQYFPNIGTDFLSISTVDQIPVVKRDLLYRVRTSTAPQPQAITSVVNAASLAPVLTPGALVWVRGTNFAAKTSYILTNSGRYPTTLAETTVTFNGLAAPLLSCSPGAILAVVPTEIKGAATAEVKVSQYAGTVAARQSETFQAPVADTSLAIFDRERCPECPDPIQNCGENGCTINATANPARRGSLITFFATGIPVTESRPEEAAAVNARLRFRASVTIGGQPALIYYAGSAPGRPWGVYHVNAQVPEGVASGRQPLVLTLDISDSEQITSAPQEVSLVIE